MDCPVKESVIQIRHDSQLKIRQIRR